MSDEIIRPVGHQLLAAEEEFTRQCVELDGFSKVLSVLRKLGRVRASKEEQGEDVKALDDLIDDSQERLRFILDSENETELRRTDFYGWAAEIESDVRAQDPLLLSFDSGSDGNGGMRSARILSQPGSFGSRGASAMLSILKSNGRLKGKDDIALRGAGGEKFFFLTTVAWGFAVIGMMITIGFLAHDFWLAQRNVAIQIERSEATPLELPAITICSDLQNVAAFDDYPTARYPGLPLFGISRYSRSNRSEISPDLEVVYPETLSSAMNTPIEDVVVSENSEQCFNVSRGFHVQREMQSLHSIRTAGSLQGFTSSGTNCLHCFRIGHKRREILEPYNVSSGSVVSPAVQVRIFRSRLFGACQSNIMRNDGVIDLAFASELELFAKDLEKTGILNFSGHNYSVLRETQKSLGVSHHVDFYCNVYFFSGFFYPSLDNANISYKYDASVKERWLKTGSGPYYSAYTWDADAPFLHGPDVRALQRDTYAMNALRLFAEEPSRVNISRAVLPRTNIAVLDATESSIFTFKKMNMQGNTEYRVKEGLGRTWDSGWKAVDNYHISFDFDTFETERILTTPTMSWPEFLTDVFEFVGLFTGICIFTLIVAPAHSIGIGSQQQQQYQHV